MNALNTRFKQVRLALQKNQSEFAELLGFAQTGISMIELGKRNVSDRHIKTICSVCNINEHWLRTGEGEMHVQTDSALIEELAAEYSLSDFDKNFIENFINLSPEKRLVFKDFINSFMTPSE